MTSRNQGPFSGDTERTLGTRLARRLAQNQLARTSLSRQKTNFTEKILNWIHVQALLTSKCDKTDLYVIWLIRALLLFTVRYGEEADYPFWKPPNSIFDVIGAQIGHFTQVSKASLSQPGRFFDRLIYRTDIGCKRTKKIRNLNFLAVSGNLMTEFPQIFCKCSLMVENQAHVQKFLWA